MSVFIFTNLIAGVTGLDKSVINTANLLADAGHDAHILNCVGSHGGFLSTEAKFPISPDVHLHSLQAMAVQGGSQLHKKFKGAFSIVQPLLKASFTEHDLSVIREVNRQLAPTDLIIFTHPLQAVLYLRSIGDNVRRAPTMLQIHGNYAEEAHNRELLIEGLSCIDHLQIVSESMRDGIREITSLPDERIHYIPNVHFPTDILRQPHEGFAAAIIGSLQDRKNQIDAVRAAARLPSIKLDVWGNAGNDYGKFIQNYVSNLDLNSRIKMRGLGSEQQIYESADLVVITSRHEGFGYTMIEAATHRIPTVAYDYEYGAREFIEDGVNGFLVPMGDVDALADRMATLSESPSLCKEMGEAALATFEAKFSPQHILSLYERLIDRNGPVRKHHFTEAFVRDGEQPFDPSSITIRKRNLFGLHYSSEIAIAPINGQRFDLYMMKGKGKPRKVKTFDKNGVVIARVPKFSSLLKRTPSKFLLAAKAFDGTFSYVMNTTKTGNVERLSEFSRSAPSVKSWQEGFSEQSVFVTGKGSHLRYHSYEPIRSISDETGQPIRFKTTHLNRNGEHAPYLAYSGEFSNLTIRYNSGKTVHVAPPRITYKELFLKLLDVEKDYSLLQYELGGFRPWELMRASVLEHLAMAFGLWDLHFDGSSNAKPSFTYVGKKMISQAPSAERLIFEFPRKGDVDYKTLPLRTGNEIIIEYPQAYGYTVDSHINGPVYPMHEFYGARKRVTLASDQKYRGDFFEPIFAREFGIDMSFGDIVSGRLLKFKQEHYFWSKVFDRTHYSEVIIPSAYWSAGICHAAKQHGMLVSDIQYALIAYLHPTNTFSAKASYTPDNIYAWSPYWAESAVKYRQKAILPRKLPEVIPIDASFDFCVMSQPRVKKRIADFLVTLATRLPNKQISYCLHPDEPIEQALRDPRIASLKNVKIFRGETFNIMAHSDICIGGYSTSLYEAAYLGKPTYVIPVPGWEVVEQGVEEGMFRVVNDPDELVPFEQPEIAKRLF
ncbi:glycosyltransferase [Sinorhizobium meliloti]|uniref:glycosyltransferase n=1 Tax=Rhizobium meliloti TaxID=382 RepID=UPI000FDBCC9A|nr:glycosyltransferase [Sinorhizobium meliloti]RVI65328.1 glycosyltransferase [Sinorhizobium meliloti]